jgi:UDP-glucose 4-epimerase
VYVRDVVDQLVAAIEAPAEAGGELPVYNVGTGREVSLSELLATLEALLGPIEVRNAPARDGDIRHSRADVTRLRRLCEARGLRPPSTPLKDGLATMLEPRPAGRP